MTSQAVIYTRVSSDDQVQGTSLDYQHAQCIAAAERHNLKVIATFSDEGKSAKSIVGREALSKALAMCLKTKAVLVVYKFDRLARNVGDAYQVRDMLLVKGCRIISASEGEANANPMAKAMYNMMMTFAELDNDMRSERSRAGMVERAKQGYWQTCPPFGMNLVKDINGNPILVPDGENSEVLKQIFLDFIYDKTDKSGTIKRIMELGFNYSGAGRIIRMPVYGGIIRGKLTDYEDIQAAFSGLISREEFYIMESKLAEPQKMRFKNNPYFPFTGVVFCKVCGVALRSGFSTSWQKKKFGYYFCKEGHVKIPAEKLHEQMSEKYSELGKLTTYMQFLRDNINNISPEADTAYKREISKHNDIINRTSAKLKRLREIYIDGTFSESEYTEERDKLNFKIHESMRWLEQKQKQRNTREQALEAMITLFSRPDNFLLSLTPEQTKDITRVLFGGISLTKSKEIELPQDSVYQVLVDASQAQNKNGAPDDEKIELITEKLFPIVAFFSKIKQTKNPERN